MLSMANNHLDYLAEIYPKLSFYQKGYNFGAALIFFSFLFFLITFSRIPRQSSSFLIGIGVLISSFVLQIDSELVRLSWYFFLPLLYYRWDGILKSIKLTAEYRLLYLFFPLMLFNLTLFIKGQDKASGFFDYSTVFF